MQGVDAYAKGASGVTTTQYGVDHREGSAANAVIDSGLKQLQTD